MSQAAGFNQQPVGLCLPDDLGEGWQQHPGLGAAHAAAGNLPDRYAAAYCCCCCCAALKGGGVDANGPKLVDNHTPSLQTKQARRETQRGTERDTQAGADGGSSSSQQPR